MSMDASRESELGENPAAPLITHSPLSADLNDLVGSAKCYKHLLSKKTFWENRNCR